MAARGKGKIRPEPIEAIARQLDPGDRLEFISEIERALAGPIEVLGDVLRDWIETAVAIRDPTNREILLGEVSASDFVEVDLAEVMRLANENIDIAKP